MRKFIKCKLQNAKCKIIENAIPIMSFFIVVLALRPYCYSVRGYHAIGGEYILALLCAIAVGAVMKKQEQSDCEPMKEEYIKQCRECNKWELIECEFDYELIPEFGKTVFATKEEAEKELKNVQSLSQQS